MNSPKLFSFVDRLLIETDKVLKTLSSEQSIAASPSPAKNIEETNLSDQECKHAAGLMRINHTGEVCAQALYQGQALTAKLPDVREEMDQAAKEELDHLSWCQERLEQLNHHPSLLNPAFYGLSISIGALAGVIGDKTSLSFVAATEELVSKHLEKHLAELPEHDQKSRAIVQQMLEDERRHQQSALEAGGSQFPTPIKLGMSLMSKVMTKTTYRL